MANRVDFQRTALVNLSKGRANRDEQRIAYDEFLLVIEDAERLEGEVNRLQCLENMLSKTADGARVVRGMSLYKEHGGKILAGPAVMFMDVPSLYIDVAICYSTHAAAKAASMPKTVEATKPRIFHYDSTSGALVTDEAIPSVTQELREHNAKTYGACYFVGETISRSAAKRIAELLGGEIKPFA